MKKRSGQSQSVFYALEAVMFAALLIMIACIVSSGHTADFNIQEAADAVMLVMNKDALQEENGLKIRDRFGLSDSDYEEAVYYGPVSNMDVEELLILKLSENEDRDAVKSAFESRIAYQKTNFDGYGTDQMELLNHAQILVKGNYAALIISKNPDQALSVYKSFLKGGR